MPANCDVIVLFLVYGQFAAIRKQDSGYMIHKIYIFMDKNLLSYKNWKQNQKLSNTVLILLFYIKLLFLSKNADFLQKNCDISKILMVLNGTKYLVLTGTFSETTCVYLSTKFQVSSIILSSFRQGG